MLDSPFNFFHGVEWVVDRQDVRYRFERFRIGERPAYSGCVYMFVATSPFRILFIGETSDLGSRLEGHERIVHAVMMGANELWVHRPSREDSVPSEMVEHRLIEAHNPPMNRQFVPGMSSISAGGRSMPGVPT